MSFHHGSKNQICVGEMVLCVVFIFRLNVEWYQDLMVSFHHGLKYQICVCEMVLYVMCSYSAVCYVFIFWSNAADKHNTQTKLSCLSRKYISTTSCIEIIPSKSTTMMQ